jgi:hypothetical protein
LVVGDARVGQHRQDHLQQRLPDLAPLTPFGQGRVGLDLRPQLPGRHRLVEQRHHLVELIDRGLRHQGQQDRIPPLLLAPLKGLVGAAPPDRGQEPATLRRQHRQVQHVRVHRPQELQLLDRDLHRRRRRLHRRRRQPRQTGHAQPDVEPQQQVQVCHHLLGQQVRDLMVRQRGRRSPRRGHHLCQGHRTRADRPRRDQVLARQVEQCRRGVVFHRPTQQELLQFLDRHTV